MRTSDNVDKILPAVMKVKAKLQAVSKSANNPFFKSKYADLNTHLDAVEPLLEENDLVLLQPVSVNAVGANVVSSIIIDKNGQFVSSEMTVVAKEADMQKLGSAITYARRYTLGALLSMKAEDDDGNFAAGKTAERTTKPAPSKVETVVQQTNATMNAAPVTTTESKLLPKDRPSFRNRPKPTTTASAPTTAPVEETPASQDDL